MSNFDSNIIKNPEIFEQNRLAAHSDHVCYKNELEKIKGKSSLRYDMNGLWKFAYAQKISPWLLVALRQLTMIAKAGMIEGSGTYPDGRL